jgi:hypothetical protein
VSTNTIGEQPEGGEKREGGSGFMADLRGSAENAPAGQSKASRVSSHHLLTVGLLAVSIGVLYGMRLYGMNSGMKFEQDKEWVDYRPPEQNSAKSERTRKLLEALETSGMLKQIAPEYIRKDPFELETHQVTIDVEPIETIDVVQEDPSAVAAADRRQRIQNGLSTLQLRSVLDGATPLARINEKNFRLGEMVEGLFVVRSIGGRSVTLECDGQEYVLTMDAPGATPVKSGPGGKRK